MVAKNGDSEKQSPEQGEIQYETPWKMLGIFAAIFLALVVYGFIN